MSANTFNQIGDNATVVNIYNTVPSEEKGELVISKWAHYITNKFFLGLGLFSNGFHNITYTKFCVVLKNFNQQ